MSFAHGSNDGQKGMGLILLILIGVVPGVFALDLGLDGKSVAAIVDQNRTAQTAFERLGGKAAIAAPAAAAELNAFLKSSGKQTPQTLPALASEIEQMNRAFLR